MDSQQFYTLQGYAKERQKESEISPAMEDYLEMIYRIERVDKYVRVNTLAHKLNVTPSSASKMVSRLKEQKLVDFQPYGIIQLTQSGRNMGQYLLQRHEILHRFFCLVNQSDNQLELVEKLEHFMDKTTVNNLEKLLLILNERN